MSAPAREVERHLGRQDPEPVVVEVVQGSPLRVVAHQPREAHPLVPRLRGPRGRRRARERFPQPRARNPRRRHLAPTPALSRRRAPVLQEGPQTGAREDDVGVGARRGPGGRRGPAPVSVRLPHAPSLAARPRSTLRPERSPSHGILGLGTADAPLDLRGSPEPPTPPLPVPSHPAPPPPRPGAGSGRGWGSGSAAASPRPPPLARWCPRASCAAPPSRPAPYVASRPRTPRPPRSDPRTPGPGGAPRRPRACRRPRGSRSGTGPSTRSPPGSPSRRGRAPGRPAPSPARCPTPTGV